MNASKPPIGEAAPRVYMASRAALRAWLRRHHKTHGPIWLVYDKAVKGAPRALTYDDIVQEALCFGWIDSVVRSLSAAQAMLYFSPRKAKSVWSALNKKRLDSLETRGLMTPAGRAVIERAKQDGSWSAIDAVAAAELPPDLKRALASEPKARKHFDAFPPGARRAILQWIITAKRPETRANRIAETARLAALNVRANTPQARGR